MKLLLVLFSVAAARFMDGVHANSHNEVRALWQQKGAFLQSLSTMRVFHTMSTLAEQQKCQASFTAFQNTAQTCLPSVATIFQPGSTDNSSTVHSKIEEYCAAQGCNTQMRDAVALLKTDCIETGIFGEICTSRMNQSSCTNDTLCSWIAPPGTAGTCRINLDFFGTLRMILGVFCLQSTATPTKYCVPSFYDFVTTKPPPNDPVAVTTQLTAGCDDCTLKIFRVWSRVEPLRAAVHFIQLANLCLRRDGKFCAVHQMNLQAAHLQAGADCKSFTAEDGCKAATRGCRWQESKCEELWTKEKLTPVCHPCTLVYAHRALFALRLMDQFQLPDPNNERRTAILVLSGVSFTVNGVCSTDLREEFCLPRIQAQLTDFTCVGMANTLKNVGCCAPSVIDLVQGLCNLDKVINTASTCQAGIDAINNRIAMCPGLNLGKTCAQLKYLIVHEAVASGIAPAWVLANRARLIDELKKVIAFAMGIDVALIVELKIAAATNGAGRRLLQAGDLQVTTTVNMPNAGAHNSAKEGLQGELESLGLNDAIQSTTPSGTLTSPVITSQSTTNIAVVPNENTSGASAAFPLLAVVVAGVFCM